MELFDSWRDSSLLKMVALLNDKINRWLFNGLRVSPSHNITNFMLLLSSLFHWIIVEKIA